MSHQVFDLALRGPYIALRRVITRALERRAGVDTGGEVQLEELDLDPLHRVRYKPSGWFTLHRILPASEVSERDVFIDFGSGKGRIVYQAAARYPLARVIGVEASERLHHVAQENLARARSRLRAREVELVCSDVLDYEVPDEVTIAYFCNPFTGPIFTSVIERLIASLERKPRHLRIIYFNPVEHRRLLDAGFQLVRTSRGMRPTREWSTSNSTRMYERITR